MAANRLRLPGPVLTPPRGLGHAASGRPGAHAASRRASTRSLALRERGFRPHVVFVDSENRLVGTGDDPAEALPGSGLVRGDEVAAAGTLPG